MSKSIPFFLIFTALISFQVPCYASLAKQASVGDDQAERGSDFSADSRYTQGSGELVNTFTGAASYQMSLFDVAAKSGLTYDIKLSYNGSIASASAFKENTIAPTGSVGLGWSLTTESVIVDSKNI